MSEGRIDGRAADELIVRMAAGDMAALEALYNAMYGEIFAYLRSMLGGDVQSAEDLAQDTFIRAYRYAPKFAAMGQGRAWVYRIAGRLAFTHLRKLPPVVGEPEPAIPSGADVEESALASRAIQEAMAAISPEERQVVSLHAVSGLTLREIADMLGQPLGTVKWRHAEAVRKLRRLLDDNQGRETADQ